jgi:hypothetical protein
MTVVRIPEGLLSFCGTNNRAISPKVGRNAHNIPSICEGQHCVQQISARDTCELGRQSIQKFKRPSCSTFLASLQSLVAAHLQFEGVVEIRASLLPHSIHHHPRVAGSVADKQISGSVRPSVSVCVATAKHGRPPPTLPPAATKANCNTAACNDA